MGESDGSLSLAPTPTPPLKGRGLRSDFPGVRDWHYLDTAATAQKPQVVLDAMMRAGGEDYATVHRGVYARSANMTVAFEAARERVARFIGAASPNEIVFVRGATEGINLVAQSWGPANLKAGDRIMLSQLEHHSNIVPWQMLAEKVGAHIDVCPLTDDGLIDLDWLEANLTQRHKLVALAHVSNVLGSILGAKRAAKAAHSVGAKLLLDGCQAAPRMRLNMAELGCDFYVFSGHKLYGPTGVGVLWAKAETLDAMPPWQGGGAMIDRVTFREDNLRPCARTVRGGNADDYRSHRPSCRHRLCRRHRPRGDIRARKRAGGADPRGLARRQFDNALWP